METPDGIQMRDFALQPIEIPAKLPLGDEHPPLTNATTFWSKYIRLVIDEIDCRDHFALERTFLAYVRTASAYAQFGVVVSQLFRLNNSDNGVQISTGLKVGNAVGASTICVAISIMLIGGAYFGKQQNGLVHGMILSRGWDVPLITTASFVLLCIILGLLAAAGSW